MNLKQFYNKKVAIVAKNGRLFEGFINDYFWPDDNENGKESIVIDTEAGEAIEFYETDIESIEIIE